MSEAVDTIDLAGDGIQIVFCSPSDNYFLLPESVECGLVDDLKSLSRE